MAILQLAGLTHGCIPMGGLSFHTAGVWSCEDLCRFPFHYFTPGTALPRTDVLQVYGPDVNFNCVKSKGSPHETFLTGNVRKITSTGPVNCIGVLEDASVDIFGVQCRNYSRVHYPLGKLKKNSPLNLPLSMLKY